MRIENEHAIDVANDILRLVSMPLKTGVEDLDKVCETYNKVLTTNMENHQCSFQEIFDKINGLRTVLCVLDGRNTSLNRNEIINSIYKLDSIKDKIHLNSITGFLITETIDGDKEGETKEVYTTQDVDFNNFLKNLLFKSRGQFNLVIDDLKNSITERIEEFEMSIARYDDIVTTDYALKKLRPISLTEGVQFAAYKNSLGEIINFDTHRFQTFKYGSVADIATGINTNLTNMFNWNATPSSVNELIGYVTELARNLAIVKTMNHIYMSQPFTELKERIINELS